MNAKSVGTIVGERIRSLRRLKGWERQEQLAEALRGIGFKEEKGKDRSAIGRMETGARKVSVDDLVALAAALEVSPLALMLPDDDRDPVAVAPAMVVPAGQVRAWAEGDAPLPGQDAEFYERTLPEAWLPWFGSGREKTLHGLVAVLAGAWDREDAKAVREALRDLEGELVRQRKDVDRLTRRQRRGTD